MGCHRRPDEDFQCLASCSGHQPGLPSPPNTQEPAIPRGYDDDPYAIPRAASKYAEVESGYDLTAHKIVERVLAQKEERKANVAKKEAKEAAYYANKEYVPEL